MTSISRRSLALAVALALVLQVVLPYLPAPRGGSARLAPPVAAAALPRPIVASAPPSGLVSEWDAEGNANDSVGSNNGSFNGTYSASQPGLGQAFLFNGSSQSVSVPNNASLDPANVTVAAWVRVDAFTTGTAPAGQDYIIFKQNTRNTQFEGYALSTINGGFGFGIASASGQQAGTGSSTKITLGQWYFVVGSYDGSTVRLYVNGWLESSSAASFPLNYGGEPLYFGQSGYAPFNGYLDGALDAVQLYNRALTDAEVQQIYQAGLAAPLPGDDPLAQSIPIQATANGGDPVSTLTGAFAYQHRDLAIAGRGPSPAFVRAYNSEDPRNGPLGPGWTDNYALRLTTPPNASGNVALVGPDGHTDVYTLSNGAYTPPPGDYTQLAKNGDGTYTATLPDQTVWRFNAVGQLTAIADRYGNTSALTYNGNGQLVGVADPAGRGSLTLAYDPTSGRLVSVTDWQTPTPRVVRYGYDGNLRLQTVTDRAGNKTTYGYDGTSSRLTTITDANQHTAITLTYDAQGRVQTQTDALTNQTTFSYATTNAAGPQTTTVTGPATGFDGFHPTTVDAYNNLGQLTQRQTTPSASDGTYTESFSYDANFDLTAHTDPRGATTTYCYDVDYAGAAIPGSAGNLTRVIAPAPAAGQNVLVTLLKYDAKRNLLETVAPKGVASGTSATCSTNFSGAVNSMYAADDTYDGNGVDLLSTTVRFTDPDLGAQTATTQYQYGDSANPGRVTAVIPPLGAAHETTYAYYDSGSQAGLLQRATDGAGDKTSYGYDAVGRETSMVDPNGQTWTTSYDNEDRVLTASAPAPQAGGSPLTTQAQYDPVGNRTVVIDANGQVTKYLYDARDSLAEVDQSPNPWTDPNATPSPKDATTYSYDALGNLSRVTRAAGDSQNERATDYAYDGLDRLRTETQYPAWPATSPTLVTSYTYDRDGNVSSMVDPHGQTTSHGYDALNRLTAVVYSDGKTPNVTYAYDADGARTSMTDGTGTTSYTTDELGRLVTMIAPNGRLTGARYDLDGNRTKVLYSHNTAVTYSYDAAERVSALTDWANHTASYTYFPDGNLKTIANPDGTTATYTEDHAQRLTQVLNQQSGGATIDQHTYTLDNVGNRTQRQETLAQVGGGQPVTTTTTYSYDKLYRLTGDGTNTYTYDPVGNRSTWTQGTTQTAYGYDKADRITSAGSTSYTVDANGNVTARGADAFTYDQANRLTSATVAGATTTYAYNGDGDRVSQTAGGTTTTYALDESGGLAQVLDDGSRQYVYGPSGLAFAVDTSNAVTAYHTDGLGSVRALTDGSGALIQTEQTDAFGNVTARQGSASQPFGFTGEQTDGDGLVYLRARYYDPSTGRFMSRDPLAGVAAAPQTLNRYSYALNNPLLLTDPSGLSPLSRVLQGIADQFDCNKHPEHLSCRSPLASLVSGLSVLVPNPGDASIEAGAKAASGGTDAPGSDEESPIGERDAGVDQPLPPSPARFANPVLLVGYFLKHKNEFGSITLREYFAGARRLVAGGDGIETKARPNGDTLFYDRSTNEFAVLTSNNVIRTYFRPTEGAQYWENIK